MPADDDSARSGASQGEANDPLAQEDDDRDESPTERLDRQFQDLLQELRVSQAGVQILFAFLLGIAFTPGFDKLADWQRDILVATLVSTALAAILFIGPVSYARIVFRQKLREPLVRAGNWMAISGLVFLMLAMLGAILLVTSVVLGTTWAALLTAAVLIVFLTIWYVLPLLAL